MSRGFVGSDFLELAPKSLSLSKSYRRVMKWSLNEITRSEALGFAPEGAGSVIRHLPRPKSVSGSSLLKHEWFLN